MSEFGDYSPGPWAGYDFSDARKSYDVHVGRSYDDAVKKGKGLEEVLEKEVMTNSTAPLVIACDVTGSMGEWPATIFSKLPYLELEGQEYLGKDMEICFAAIGDAYCDDYSLQVRPFSKGTDLAKKLQELVIEGGGGGTASESYDLAALYFSRNCKMPKAINPILIMIGDEGLYDYVDSQQARDIAGVALQSRMSIETLMEDLKSKYSVYLVRKPYGYSSGNMRSSDDIKIQKQWEDLLGQDKVYMLPEAGRIVDVIFGILAEETGRMDYFKKELTDRQKPEQVKTVMKTLRLDGDVALAKLEKKASGKSVMNRDPSAKPTKSLF